MSQGGERKGRAHTVRGAVGSQAPSQGAGASAGSEDTRCERVVDAAWRIASAQGLAAVSARGVAREAGVSVGALYKMFPTKSDIVVAAATRFFERAFFEDFCHINPDETFIAYARRLYARAVDVLRDFRAHWLADREDMPQADLVAARLRGGAVVEHAERGLAAVAAHDGAIRWDELPEGVDAASVAAFTFTSMLTALTHGEEDCPVLFVLLERGLYGSGRA